jgi:hypothetical protein
MKGLSKIVAGINYWSGSIGTIKDAVKARWKRILKDFRSIVKVSSKVEYITIAASPIN